MLVLFVLAAVGVVVAAVVGAVVSAIVGAVAAVVGAIVVVIGWFLYCPKTSYLIYSSKHLNLLTV